ncbi:hypothetical protein OIDMADRAFT_173149 [Oidiodendron maius Zn]|uniref:Uncharacterized protein n=1 Tax=Oidiodendron maius (strain Zn) TaxID=913774 RepID=A0A0C3GQ57_OIDMZ|nr:hypothetical protein OIDMADRAFT_173149 [Oidiodendron maius Zn]
MPPESLNLALRIGSLGAEMSPCSSCQNFGRTRVGINEESKKCGERVRRRQDCDVMGLSPGEWAQLQREQDRLKFERDAALTAAMEGLARVQRLEKQQELLKKRGAEMIRRGLQTVDELEEIEERERREKEDAMWREHQIRAMIDSSPDVLGDLVDPTFDSSDPFWAMWDFGSGTPRASP